MRVYGLDPITPVYAGPDNSFVFSSAIEDWMPKFREQREGYKEIMRKRRSLRDVKTGGKRFSGKNMSIETRESR